MNPKDKAAAGPPSPAPGEETQVWYPGAALSGGLPEPLLESMRELAASSSRRNRPEAAKPPAPRRQGSRLLARLGQVGEPLPRAPLCVARQSGGPIWVLDAPGPEAFRLLLLSAEGTVQAQAAIFTAGNGPGQLKYPRALALDSQGGIYIPDAGNDRILHLDAQGQAVGTIGDSGNRPGQFEYPSDLTLDTNDLLYVADAYNGRVQKLTSQGLNLLSLGAGPARELAEPGGVGVDPDGRVYVTDPGQPGLLSFAADGTLLGRLGGENGPTFESPGAVRIGGSDSLFVADRENSRIRRFARDGRCLGVFEQDRPLAPSTVSGFFAIDSEGLLLVCDTYSHCLLRLELFPPEAMTEGRC